MVCPFNFRINRANCSVIVFILLIMWGKVLKIAWKAAAFVVLNWKELKPFWDDTVGKLFGKKGDKNKPGADNPAGDKPQSPESGETKNQ
jgi:hypothetical protein